ncbi:hypothetical protein BB8028_0002g15280 [Beauveria bassiana]|uniref:Uncharacterized protein n=1 Tax=Beauveria bassiana TaxID=176275 RepID=A0A2S7Y510_BEABA|nr:hypothetical protein BB8028_0002g15280 [Beauveria bassiana]
MDVVASLPESHLRAILVALCKDPYTHDRVISMASKLAAAPSSCNGSDLAICVQCKQAFFRPDACRELVPLSSRDQMGGREQRGVG